MKYKNCRNCGHANPMENKYCSKCGTVFRNMIPQLGEVQNSNSNPQKHGRLSQYAIIGAIVVFVCMIVLLAGVVHKHSWLEATCAAPQTCSECGKTVGEALEHQWQYATCTAPQTCSECGKTVGEVLGHQWRAATCTAPKTCDVCDATEGTSQSHIWVEATLTSPKTCSSCGIYTGSTLLDDILAKAERYVAERKYRLAIQLLDNAWKQYSDRQFYDLAAKYRTEFGVYNTSYIAAGKYNSLMIRENGSINIVGNNEYGELAAGEWGNIVCAAVGDTFVVGLKADGTVVAAGSNKEDQYTTVEQWRKVVAISTGDFHTVGLLADGVVVSSQGYNHCGQNDVQKLMDAAGTRKIVAISAGYDHTLALLEDGTAVACGDRQVPGRNDNNGVCNVLHWQDIAAICSGSEFCAGLRTDGRVVVSGANLNVSNWNNIISLAAGDFFLVGLRSDGTVLIASNEEEYSKKSDVLQDLLETTASWEDVSFVAAGHDHIMGIRSDGKIICAGSNKLGQCALAGNFVHFSD